MPEVKLQYLEKGPVELDEWNDNRRVSVGLFRADIVKELKMYILFTFNILS